MQPQICIEKREFPFQIVFMNEKQRGQHKSRINGLLLHM